MNRRIRSFRVGGAVPGITVRLLVVVVVWAGVVVLNPFPLWRVVAVIAALVAVFLPRSLAAWAGAGCLVFGVILTDPAPERTALAVLLVPAIHVLASLSLVIPISSRLALAALGPSLMRFLVIQLLAQPVVFAVWLLAPSSVDRGASWLAPLAAAALLLGVLLALRAARKSDRPPGTEPAVGWESGGGSAAATPGGADVRGPS
ncbi:hypothetical protein [Microbacterium sp. MYb62]|uniref:hypothetical protein n=1 Tax=Microbacterium sp. MYb62 TaxID=1848690 RepID=UPI000CFD24EA|nr:hypothetical protein [Microbacterium sp. MYb62]PRB12228.1 hypothetical protein CQ042_15565 [Microbacterium sp. MYb62]